MSKLFQSFFIFIIRIYQRFISPVTPSSCRFQPTCSSYAKKAISLHGPWRGSWLAIKRLSRCHPFGGHGYDPVPEKQSK